ncbi:DNA cytosine methyltransferase [Pseudomonas sp. CCI3.1]|uniref:DNA cytosine methyltransferase n=1 Tax=Pseudomonas sp. CCI3.1 TaxID=3048618 RepID=UPI002AB440AF|nr:MULTISPECIES: DNA cytosine methyltransferase [unclassified Pseudomonas]MDY7584708.1 DNA cytosine methyltransferase [Pseudomonas sp. CCI3.1]MEB0066670.1 DNA cytosine methyltransferase [Pseudomonas sp. CCI3.1]MEB0071963.1 DNA cytosine methyltransferase [Pseudomonas sp. CCI1.4]
MPMTYGSVCSGIEAATQAWHPLGMRTAWFAEIEPFPSAVLAHHYPDVPNHGDMTKLAALVLAGKIPAPDVLVGGTPCQAFSVAGMREGLTDPRGALTIKYVELADAVDYVRAGQRKPASVIVWENVPGVLSDKGNAFGYFLGALAGEDCELQPPRKKWEDAGCVYGPKRTIAWRVLDAQYFGLAQRRRRVFVVASARDGFDPTAVLFEREGARRDFSPGWPEKRQLHPTLTAQGGGSLDDREAYVLEASGVRRTTPVEWERCQGLPDNYTLIPWRGKPSDACPDGPRYKAIGNSKAVLVIKWIGCRIQAQLTS